MTKIAQIKVNLITLYWLNGIKEKENYYIIIN